MSTAAIGEEVRSEQPTRWWQWLLIYPALGISVLTAVPTIVDKAGAIFINLVRDKDQPVIASLGDAQMQSAMWQRNMNCNTELHSWQETSVGLKIDATICPLTGDVLVQAVGSDHRQYARWLSAKEQVVADDGPSANHRNVALRLIPDASAAQTGMPLMFTGQERGRFGFRRAQVQQVIICQRQIDARTLLRRIATPQACFDIIIDTYTGQVIRQNGAPCVPQC